MYIMQFQSLSYSWLGQDLTLLFCLTAQMLLCALLLRDCVRAIILPTLLLIKCMFLLFEVIFFCALNIVNIFNLGKCHILYFTC